MGWLGRGGISVSSNSPPPPSSLVDTIVGKLNQTTAYLCFITAVKRLKTFKVSLLLHRKRLHRRKGAGELLQRAGEVQTRSGHGEGIHTHNRQCHGFTVIFQCYFTLRQVIIWMTLTTGGKQNRTEATVLVCVFKMKLTFPIILQEPSQAVFKEKLKEFMANFDKNADGRIEMSEVRRAGVGLKTGAELL